MSTTTTPDTVRREADPTPRFAAVDAVRGDAETACCGRAG